GQVLLLSSPRVRPRVEAELQLQHTDLRRPPLRKEDSDGAQGEPSPTAKQHKKAKKRKSLGVPPPLAATAVVPGPAEALGLESEWHLVVGAELLWPALSVSELATFPEAFARGLLSKNPKPLLLIPQGDGGKGPHRVLSMAQRLHLWSPAGKAQRLRPLYQYINYSNPELNQAGEGEAEIQVELGLVPDEASGGPEEAGAERPQASPLGGEGGEAPVPILSFTPGSQLKAEVDKSTQVDIDKMLSVCAAHLVPPLSPQYK
uniref:Uncharacterized protein n=1 Tax=Vombatus ursinus TaxID=29139 RepID=A0A4X2LV89_VOMUR